ncbi:unnamed protein product [Rhizophagus irregularis]|nr:unnamed protein product [Rhizophagus irregularis]
MEKETFQIIKRPEALGGVRPVFDGRTNMFTHKPLPFEGKSFDVKLEEGNVPVARKRPPEDFRITIRKARDIDMEELFQFLFAKSRMTENCQMAITAMDIIISHEISAKYPTVQVCDVIPQQRYMRKLDKNLTDEMMKFTRQNPNVRANKIHDGLNILNYKGNEYLKQFGMEVSKDMAVVNARILPTPTIQYHQSSREHRVRPNGGAWNLRDKKVANGATLSSWSVMVFSNYKHLPDQAIKFFVRELVNTCQDTGMNILDRDPPICEDDPTILMGADVTHPTATADDESPSYAALCGSMNVKASRYAASLRVQTGDGVSESQFMEVLECELTAIRAACRSLEASYKPNITFVVVQKRHHTRLFPIHGGDRTGNCIPGTVVDMDITHPFEFDFYLLSHAGLLGTSRPAHYRVLYDENGFDANRLQMLSYNLCYVYARCTRAVSLVPPVYYAHLAAARAKIHSPYRDTDTESSKGDKSTATTIGEVKGELRKVMYFM